MADDDLNVVAAATATDGRRFVVLVVIRRLLLFLAKVTAWNDSDPVNETRRLRTFVRADVVQWDLLSRTGGHALITNFMRS